MTRLESFSWYVQAVCLLMAIVWVWAAVTKLRHLGRFRESATVLAAPVPRGLTVALATTIPPVEFALGVALLVPSLRRFALAVSAALLFVFLAVLLRGFRKHVEVGCTCFGNESETRITAAALLRTGLLLLGVCSCLVVAPVQLSRRLGSLEGLGLTVGLAVVLLTTGALAVAVVQLRTTVERRLLGGWRSS